MSADPRIAALKDVIMSSRNRCGDWTVEDGEPCDGTEGCDECLTIIAEAVLAELA